MLRRCSLETMMKWIFMSLALSLVMLTIGARLYQSYEEKRCAAIELGARVREMAATNRYIFNETTVLETLGSAWSRAESAKGAELEIDTADRREYYNLDTGKMLVSLVEEERYLILVGMLGLVAAVELAVFISYILTRPLRRLAWGCREIAEGAPVSIPQNRLSPYEFYELTDSFNKMAKQLRQWKEVQMQLSRMDRLAALGKMISGLSHEIRNPLASMRIQIDLLSSEVESMRSDSDSSRNDDIESAVEHISVLGCELDRLNAIVTQLLSFVRTREPMLEIFCLDSLILWCKTMLKAEAERNGIELVTVVNDVPVTVTADGEMLRQLIMNLALNAIQAMDEFESERKKTLEITVGYSNSDSESLKQAVITVRDNGGGIPSDVSHRIFDPFFTTKRDGTGLGLSIVQQIVAGHRGHISLESSSEGTSFSVFLPASSAECRSEDKPGCLVDRSDDKN